MTVTANLFQISKGTPVKAVLRNLPCLPECPAGESQSQNLALAGGVSRQWPVYIAPSSISWSRWFLFINNLMACQPAPVSLARCVVIQCPMNATISLHLRGLPKTGRSMGPHCNGHHICGRVGGRDMTGYRNRPSQRAWFIGGLAPTVG